MNTMVIPMTGTDIAQQGKPNGAKMPKKNDSIAQSRMKNANQWVYLNAMRRRSSGILMSNLAGLVT
jgi:hypothetical protein